MSKQKTVGSQLIVLFKLATPIILGNIAYAILGLTDILMAGMAGTADQAGVAIGGSFFYPSITFIIGMVSALHPIISRYCGANTKEKIPQAHAHSTLACFLVGLVIMAILLILAFTSIHMESDQRMEDVARYYVLCIAFTIPTVAFFTNSRAYCEAMGNTKTTLYFGLLAIVLNIPLNYTFIFGKFGVPAFGGIGCGIGTLISMFISMFAMLIYIAVVPSLKPYSFLKNKDGINKKDLMAFFKLSIPLGIAAAVETSCFTMIALMLSPFGPIAVSSHSIALSITSFVFNIPLSVGIATSIMVGYAIGKNNIHTLALNIKAAYRSMLICMAINVSLLYFGKDFWPSIFSKDMQVVTFASSLLIFASCNQIFECVQTIQAFILRGFKDTKIIFFVTLIAFYLIALTIGTLLCYNYIKTPFGLEGPYGYWIGLFLGLLTASILYRFRVLKHYRELKAKLKNLDAQGKLEVEETK